MRNRRLYKEIFAGCLAAALLLCSRTDGQAAWESVSANEEMYTEDAEDSVVVKEEDHSFWAGKSVKVGRPLMAQLNEALVLEQQMELSKDSREKEILLARYKEILTEAVTGEDTENADGKEQEICADKRTADYYRDFIHANGDSRTAEILKEYCEALENCDYQLGAEITEFYKELPRIIEKWGRIEKGDFQYLLWKWGLLR